MDKYIKKLIKQLFKKFKHKRTTSSDLKMIGAFLLFIAAIHIFTIDSLNEVFSHLIKAGIFGYAGYFILNKGWLKSRYIKLRSQGILKAVDVPEYTGIKRIVLNDNQSNFTEAEIAKIHKQLKGSNYGFSKLDAFKRPSTAVAILKPSIYNTEIRKSMNVFPTGFKNQKLKNDVWLYNRSHLLAYSFINENIDVLENLITGTRDFNADRDWGMLHYEDILREYLSPYGKKYHSKNEIVYQVTPIFKGIQKLSLGVQIRAYSLKGNPLDINVFIYNVQDGIDIRYSDGSAINKKKGMTR